MSRNKNSTKNYENENFRVGERVDTGIALAYRITDSIKQYPQTSLFMELAHQYIGKDNDDEGSNPNSGGDTIFLIPGVRMGLKEDVGLVLAPSIPILQSLNGEQLKTDFRLLSQLFVRF